MNQIKRNVPNAITCLNLLFGCMAIICALHNRLTDASWMIVYAAIADFFDGMAARLLKVSSPIGKELDSLADMVSFGVAPGMLIYQLIGTTPYHWIALIVPVFAAIRLAKFNIDTRQTFYFIGLPTPANAIFIASFPLIIENNQYWNSLYFSNVFFDVWFFTGVAIACAVIMVYPVRLFSLKMKNMAWSGNKARYTFLAVALICLMVWGYVAVPVIMILYVIFSLFSKKSFAPPAAI